MIARKISVLIAVGALGAIALFLLFSRRSDGHEPELTLERGPARAAFPEGSHVRVGSIGKPAAGFRKVDFAVKVRNVGRVPLDLASFRVGSPCCTRLTLGAEGRLAPGELGNLRFQATVPSSRVGTSAITIPLHLGKGDGPPGSGIELTLNFEVEQGALVGWGQHELSFQELCAAGNPETRTVELSVQPYQADGIEPKLVFEGNARGLSARIESSRPAKGLSGQDAIVYSVKVTAEPRSLSASRGSARLKLSGNGIPENVMPVNWRIMPVFERSPSGTLLVKSSVEESINYVSIWNIHKGIQIKQLSVSPGVMVEEVARPPSGNICMVRVMTPAGFHRGKIEILLEAGDQLHTEVIEIQSLDSYRP